MESSRGQGALYRRTADCCGVGAGREDGRGLGRLCAGAGRVQVAVRQAGRCIDRWRLCPHAGGWGGG